VRRGSTLVRLVVTAAMGVGAGVLLAPTAASADAVVPFPCDGEAYVAQGRGPDFQLYRADQSASPVVFQAIKTPALDSVNAISFNRKDGFLYGTVNGGGVVKIDSAGGSTSLGVPVGVPAIFDNAGDVTTDGRYYYRWVSGVADSLVRIDLTSSPLTGQEVPVAGLGVPGSADIAINPVDGHLYGADTAGRLVEIDPAAGTSSRTAVTGLPSGKTFGAVWFDAAGTFFAYDNTGTLYAVDVTVPSVRASSPGPASDRNDGTACINDAIGLAKRMTVDPASAPTTATIRLTLQNPGGDVLREVNISDDLTVAFGTGSDWSVTEVSRVSGPSTVSVATDYDGRGRTDILAAGSSLAAGESAVVDVTVSLTKAGRFRNQARAVGQNPAGTTFGDLSTAGVKADPNDDGAPIEREPSTLDVAPTPPPTARPDAASTSQGAPTTIDVLANDGAGNPADPLDPASVRLLDPATGGYVSTLTVAGEGTYTVDPATGAVTFAPSAGFTGTATPITYRVADGSGATSTAALTVSVSPVPSRPADLKPDVVQGVPGSPVSADPLANDTPPGGATFVPSSVRLTDPATGRAAAQVVVQGEGAWTVSPAGRVTFVPLTSLTGSPTPIEYQVRDSLGGTSRSTIRIQMTAGTEVLGVSNGPSGGELAMTGADLAGPALVGALLMLGGAGLLAGRRLTRPGGPWSRGRPGQPTGR
jgi:CshA-type fibril repeat protein